MKDTEWHFLVVLYYCKFMDENLWYVHSSGGF